MDNSNFYCFSFGGNIFVSDLADVLTVIFALPLVCYLASDLFSYYTGRKENYYRRLPGLIKNNL